MKIRINFAVSSNALPAIIVIREMNGRLILYETVYQRQNSLCFCSESENLIITMRPFNLNYNEKKYYLKFGCCPCYSINLNFVFTATTSGRLQRFHLLDANYSFPIENATLIFTGG